MEDQAFPSHLVVFAFSKSAEAGGEQECTLAELDRVAGPLVIAYLPVETDRAGIVEAGS